MMIDYGSRGRVGILLPSVNQAAEPQLRAMLPADIAISVTRLKLADSSDEALLGMANNVDMAAELLADAQVDLIVFHCTAVSTYSVELEASIIKRIRAATRLPAVATSQALVAALDMLGARRIVMLSPYPAAVDRREAAFFEARGFQVVSSAGLDCITARQMMSVTPEEWQQRVLSAAHPDADAYVLSCTTVRTAEVVESLEALLDRPVLTSNSAVAWYCMRLLEASGCVEGFGTLLAQPVSGRCGAAHQ